MAFQALERLALAQALESLVLELVALARAQQLAERAQQELARALVRVVLAVVPAQAELRPVAAGPVGSDRLGHPSCHACASWTKTAAAGQLEQLRHRGSKS